MSCHSCGIVPPFLLVSIRDHVAANPEFYAELATDLMEFAYDKKAYLNYWNTSVPAKCKLPAYPEYPNEEHQKTLDRASGAAAIGSKSSPNDTSDGKGDGKKEQSDDEQERSIGASAQSAAAAAASARPPNEDDSASADAARGVSAGGGSTGSHTSSAAKSEGLLSRLQKPSWYTGWDAAAQLGAGGAAVVASALTPTAVAGTETAVAVAAVAVAAAEKAEVGASERGSAAIAATKKAIQGTAYLTAKLYLTTCLTKYYFASQDLTAYLSEKHCHQIFISNAKDKTVQRNGKIKGNISDEIAFPRTLAGIKARSKSRLAARTYWAIERTLAFLAQRFDRNSIDGKGQMIIASIHYPREDGKKLSNAYWSTSKQQMRIGDGDGLIFNAFGWDLTTIVHETIHGMTQHTLNLRYQGESGALDEHISDVFAILGKNNTLWDSPSEDIKADPVWYIGEDLVRSTYKYKLLQSYPGQFFHALRSMKNPGSAYNLGPGSSDPQVSKKEDYVEGGDVHTNSGIPNKAFYLFATHVGEKALRTAGKVWYATITSGKLQNNATFIDFANETISHVNPFDRFVLRQAWSDVGITV